MVYYAFVKTSEVLIRVGVAAAILAGGFTANAKDTRYNENPPGITLAASTLFPELTERLSKREKGAYLQKLDFSNFEGKVITNPAVVEKFTLEQQTSSNYRVMVDLKQLLFFAQACNLDAVPQRFHIILADDFATAGNNDQPELSAFSDGREISVFLSLNRYSALAERNLRKDFEIDESQLARTVQNLAVLKLNEGLLRLFCATSAANQAASTNVSNEQAQKMAEEGAASSKDLVDQMLIGEVRPAIVFQSQTGRFI